MDGVFILLVVMFVYNIVMGWKNAKDGNGVTMVHCTLAIVLSLVLIFRRLFVI